MTRERKLLMERLTDQLHGLFSIHPCEQTSGCSPSCLHSHHSRLAYEEARVTFLIRPSTPFQRVIELFTSTSKTSCSFAAFLCNAMDSCDFLKRGLLNDRKWVVLGSQRRSIVGAEARDESATYYMSRCTRCYTSKSIYLLRL